MRKTKIVCTLGPASMEEDVIRELMLAGMNVARQNFSHGDHDFHRALLGKVRKVQEELKLPVASLLDTKGPEVRVKQFKNGKVTLTAGEKFTLTTVDCEGTAQRVAITYKHLPADIEVGTRILADDGLLEFKVLEINEIAGDAPASMGYDIVCRVVTGGVFSNNKSCNFPGRVLSMPYLSERDKADVIFGCENGFDYIAASFVSTADDVLQLRKILEENGGAGIRIIAKIENQSGVDNIDDIIRVADGIMVARGDMGVEIPFEHLPEIQKMLINKTAAAGKQVITATQMLDSMVKNPRPTRAEISDVANAIYDGSCAVMLSGETAAGEHPVESVKTMATIAEYAEQNINYDKRFYNRSFEKGPNVSGAISHATVLTSITLGAKAILTVTETGGTPRNISKFRPSAPVVTLTTNDTTWRQMALVWGVTPVMGFEVDHTDELVEQVSERAKKTGLIEDGDVVVVTAGVPLGVSGTTNLMKVHVCGGTLARGTGIPCSEAKSADGKITAAACVIHSPEDINNFVSRNILVVKETTNEMMTVLRAASGIIAEAPGKDSHAAIVGLSLDIPVVVGASGATALIANGITVTMDAKKGIVSA